MEQKNITVAINGFGRIGRFFFRRALHTPGITVVAINDLGNIDNLAYLLKYDSVYGTLPEDVRVEDGFLIAGNVRAKVLSEKDPALLPWSELSVDVVVESTGEFDTYEKASAHVKAGARRVVITAPVKEGVGTETGATVLMGLNDTSLKDIVVSSNASCTTNAASPLIAILDESIGIEKAILNTVHGYTATQSIVDSPVKGSDMRRGRAAAVNIVPSSTGAAVAVTQAYPSLLGKFDGVAMRVPVPSGSMVDVTFVAKRNTFAEEINDLLEKASGDERWKGIFSVTREQLVSTDILGLPYASIADLSLTRVVDGNLVKVLAWYDNEAGYTETLLRHVIQAGRV